LLEAETSRTNSIVIIDEIRFNRFVSKKIKKGGVNLLGGGARTRYLHPLCSAELKFYAFDYLHPAETTPIHNWRSQSGFEVDFILGDSVAVEVKASANIGKSDLRGLQALAEEKRKMKRLIVVGLFKERRQIYDIELILYQDFLQELWAGDNV